MTLLKITNKIQIFCIFSFDYLNFFLKKRKCFENIIFVKIFLVFYNKNNDKYIKI